MKEKNKEKEKGKEEMEKKKRLSSGGSVLEYHSYEESNISDKIVTRSDCDRTL